MVISYFCTFRNGQHCNSSDDVVPVILLQVSMYLRLIKICAVYYRSIILKKNYDGIATPF